MRSSNSVGFHTSMWLRAPLSRTGWPRLELRVVPHLGRDEQAAGRRVDSHLLDVGGPVQGLLSAPSSPDSSFSSQDAA